MPDDAVPSVPPDNAPGPKPVLGTEGMKHDARYAAGWLSPCGHWVIPSVHPDPEVEARLQRSRQHGHEGYL